MAKIGLMKPKYAKVTVTEDETGAEQEAYGPGKVFAKAISASTSINTSDTKLYADDGIAETSKEFISGQITFASDDIDDDVEADISGAAVDEETGGIVNKDTDTPQYVRFGFIIRRMKRNQVQYRAVIFPRVQFAVPGDDYETKGESIVFKNTTVTGEVMRNYVGEWRVRSKWTNSAAEAETWLEENISPKPAEATAAEGEA